MICIPRFRCPLGLHFANRYAGFCALQRSPEHRYQGLPRIVSTSQSPKRAHVSTISGQQHRLSLQQFADQNHDQPVQSGANLPSWSMERAGCCEVCHAKVSWLVQRSPAAGTHWKFFLSKVGNGVGGIRRNRQSQAIWSLE